VFGRFITLYFVQGKTTGETNKKPITTEFSFKLPNSISLA
jgi:hypothetical protein